MAKLAVTIDHHTYDVELTLAPQCGEGCYVTVNGQQIPLIIPDLRQSPAGS